MRQCSSRSLPPGESDQGRESATFGAHSRQLFAPSAFCTSSARILRSTAPSVRTPPQLQTRLRRLTPFISNALPRVTSRRASPACLWRRTTGWPRGRASRSSLHSAAISVSLSRSAFASSARSSSVVSLSICSLLHFATRPRGRIGAARVSLMTGPGFTSPVRYTGLMLAARGPLGLCSTSYCTLSLSFSVLNPLAWMDEKCTKRSLLPSSGVMKPKPLASLNHFTVPVLMFVSLISIRKKGAIGRKAALRKIKERTNRRGQYEPLRPDQPTRCLRILLYRYTGIRARSPISFHLGARRNHDLSPLLGLGGDHLAEILRGALEGLAAEFGQALEHAGIGEGAIHFGVDLLDDLSRSAFGHADAEPGGSLVAVDGFGDGGEVGHRRLALRGGDGERADPAAVDMRGGGGQVVEEHMNLAGDEVGEGGAGALVGHVQHVATGHRLEELAGEMYRGAVAGRG